MRLIDADDLINELASFREKQEDPKEKDIVTTVSLFVEVYARTTTPIDISVVRCKDCVHYHKADRGHPDTDWCKRLICGTIKPNFFCADGERRSE